MLLLIDDPFKVSLSRGACLERSGAESGQPGRLFSRRHLLLCCLLSRRRSAARSSTPGCQTKRRRQAGCRLLGRAKQVLSPGVGLQQLWLLCQGQTLGQRVGEGVGRRAPEAQGRLGTLEKVVAASSPLFSALFPAAGAAAFACLASRLQTKIRNMSGSFFVHYEKN